MKILTTAKPNPKYRWFKSTYKQIEIHAVDENGQLKFMEESDGTFKSLKKETVLSLFQTEVPDEDIPFYISENKLFFAYATGRAQIPITTTFTRRK